MTRVQADVVPAIKDWLAAQITEADVSQNADGWKPGARPVLVVADDGGPVRWPVKSQHTIRLTAYAAGRTEAGRIVRLAAAKLAESRPRPTGVAHVDPEMSGVLYARDKATRAELASLLITVQARTVEV